MLAKELISIIQEYNPSWSRQAIQNDIEYVQRIMYEHTTMWSRAYTIDGKDPEFTVSDDNTIIIPDAFRIEAVYRSVYTHQMETVFKGNTVYFIGSFAEIGVPEEEKTKYKVRYYKKAEPLTSEKQELLIPSEYIDVLEKGVVARMAFKQHGSTEEFNIWKLRDLPKFWGHANQDFRFNRAEIRDTRPDHYGVR